MKYGDWLLIKRTGKLRDTRYTAEKLDGLIFLRTKNHPITCWCLDCARLDLDHVSDHLKENITQKN